MSFENTAIGLQDARLAKDITEQINFVVVNIHSINDTDLHIYKTINQLNICYTTVCDHNKIETHELPSLCQKHCTITPKYICCQPNIQQPSCGSQTEINQMEFTNNSPGCHEMDLLNPFNAPLL